MQALGADVEHNLGGNGIYSGLTSAQIDTFPIIQFILHDQDGNRINIAHVHPREYLIPIGRTSCLFALDPHDDRCILSPAILRKTVLHFDAVNNRVGFADTIDEI